jgi:DNA-binding NarL/FixJ family response regulator
MNQEQSQADIDPQLLAEIQQRHAEFDALVESGEWQRQQEAALEELLANQDGVPTPEASQPTYRGRPLPWPVREQIASLRRAGKSLREIAADMGLSVNTVKKYATQV